MGLVEFAGGLIIALVLGNGIVILMSSIRRAAGQRRQERLALDLLAHHVAAAALLKREREQARHVWEGFRKFVVDRKVIEGENVASVYLIPFDGMPLPAFRPGQFLTFQFKIPGQPRPVVRCYSLSDSFHPGNYRVTIKKIPPPPDRPGSPGGLVSTFVHDVLKEGDIVDVQAPRGDFALDLGCTTPIVLIAGGIGLTPLLCMINALAERGAPRETWLFYGVRNGREHIMKDHLRRLEQEREGFRLRVCYSNPGPDDLAGRDYHHAKRVSLEVLKAELPSNNYEFYVCGPPGLMVAIGDALKSWGVPDERVYSEAFGPASVPKPATATAAAPVAGGAPAPGFKIVFGRSGKSLAWDAQSASVLELAERNGVQIPSGCRAGNCGTCETAVKSGKVQYLREPGWKSQAGTCLVCVATPGSDLELDA